MRLAWMAQAGATAWREIWKSEFGPGAGDGKNHAWNNGCVRVNSKCQCQSVRVSVGVGAAGPSMGVTVHPTVGPSMMGVRTTVVPVPAASTFRSKALLSPHAAH